MIDAKKIYALTVAERKAVLEKQAANVTVPNNITKGLHSAYRTSKVIGEFVDEYFDLAISQDETHDALKPRNLRRAIKMEIDSFLPHAIDALISGKPTKENLQKSSRNLYELSGAAGLSFANKATRTLSTTMGSLWERIANVSPYAIEPETEFGLKITGVDLIVRNINTNNIEFLQLKTQKNTLTGSQKPRSVQELSLHNNPVFCACFSTNANWTFNDKNIPRVEGAEFWGRIGMDYDKIVLPLIAKMILELESEFIRLLG